VLGISGGQDSTLTGKLCQIAADTQHQRFNKRVSLQIGFQEIDAATDLVCGINPQTRSVAASIS
jgi:NH3-dependent NAD+ synthetase